MCDADSPGYADDEWITVDRVACRWLTVPSLALCVPLKAQLSPHRTVYLLMLPREASSISAIAE
jgi:hypothetical protein